MRASGRKPQEPRVPAKAPSVDADFERADWLIECFTTGYCSCPREYRDSFADAWLDSHPADHAILFAAMGAIHVVERIQESHRARRLAGGN